MSGMRGNPNLTGTPLGTSDTLTVNPETTQMYYVLVNDQDTDECVTDGPAVDSILVEVNPVPSLVLDTIVCLMDGSGAIVRIASDAAQITSDSGEVVNIGGDIYEVVAFPGAKLTFVAAFPESGCSSSLMVIIPDDICDPCTLLVDAVAEPEDFGCLNIKDLPVDVALMANITGAQGQVTSIRWFDNPDQQGMELSRSLSFVQPVDAPTTFYVLVEDEEGCIAMDSIAVLFNTGPKINFDPVCAPDSSSYTLSGTVMGVSELVANGETYQVLSDGSFAIPDVSSDMQLMISAIDPVTQCVTDTIFDPRSICCVPALVPQPTVAANRLCIIRGDTTQLFAIDCPGCSYEWSNGLEPVEAPVVMPEATTTYNVTMTDEAGCRQYIRSVKIEVTDCGPENIFLPNAFTPNDDGRNDILTLRLFNVSKVEVLIYSRWGEEIVNFDWELPFGEPADVGEDGLKPRQLPIWDGVFRGAEQPPAVYGYYLKATCVNAGEPIMHEEQGNITLLK